MPDPENAKMYYFCFYLSSLGEICFLFGAGAVISSRLARNVAFFTLRP